jgi:hypothetical protein
MLQCIKDGNATFSKRGKEIILGSDASAANIVESMNASSNFGKSFFKVSNREKWESVANILLNKASNMDSPPAEITAEMMDAIWGNDENTENNDPNIEQEITKNRVLLITKDIQFNCLQEAVIKHCLDKNFSSFEQVSKFGIPDRKAICEYLKQAGQSNLREQGEALESWLKITISKFSNGEDALLPRTLTINEKFSSELTKIGITNEMISKLNKAHMYTPVRCNTSLLEESENKWIIPQIIIDGSNGTHGFELIAKFSTLVKNMITPMIDESNSPAVLADIPSTPSLQGQVHIPPTPAQQVAPPVQQVATPAHGVNLFSHSGRYSGSVDRSNMENSSIINLREYYGSGNGKLPDARSLIAFQASIVNYFPAATPSFLAAIFNFDTRNILLGFHYVMPSAEASLLNQEDFIEKAGKFVILKPGNHHKFSFTTKHDVAAWLKDNDFEFDEKVSCKEVIMDGLMGAPDLDAALDGIIKNLGMTVVRVAEKAYIIATSMNASEEITKATINRAMHRLSAKLVNASHMAHDFNYMDAANFMQEFNSDEYEKNTRREINTALSARAHKLQDELEKMARGINKKRSFSDRNRSTAPAGKRTSNSNKIAQAAAAAGFMNVSQLPQDIIKKFPPSTCRYCIFGAHLNIKHDANHSNFKYIAEHKVKKHLPSKNSLMSSNANAKQ